MNKKTGIETMEEITFRMSFYEKKHSDKQGFLSLHKCTILFLTALASTSLVVYYFMNRTIPPVPNDSPVPNTPDWRHVCPEKPYILAKHCPCFEASSAKKYTLNKLDAAIWRRCFHDQDETVGFRRDPIEFPDSFLIFAKDSKECKSFREGDCRLGSSVISKIVSDDEEWKAHLCRNDKRCLDSFKTKIINEN